MAVQNHRVLGGGATPVVIVGLMVIATGCVAPPQFYPETGLSHNLEVVGGGLTINWKAPTPGTVYLVEKTSGKIIETKSLEEGGVYEFDIDPEQTAAFERAVGVQLNNARIVLLFKPANRKSQTP